MSTSINTNIAAFYAQANIALASNLASSSVARLSSGNRIVQASDDVTALAIGASLSTQVSSLTTAATNASQGTSLLQVADGALAQIQSILQQQQSIASQAQAGALTDTNRGFLDQQFQALTAQIDALAQGTTFNGVQLVDGSIATGGSTNPLRHANAASAGTSAVIAGTVANAGVTSVVVASDTTNNDSTLYGDLSKGVFAGLGGTDANQQISFTINGSTYIGTYTADTTTLALDNGKSTLTFTLPGDDANGALDSQTGASLATQLTSFFASAKGYAVHSVATVDATDSNGNTIAGTGIETADTAGTLLNGFDGSKVLVQSQLFGTNNLPPVTSFSATGFGTNTVFSVLVNGVTYSTTGTVAGSATTISATTFNGITTDLAGNAQATGLVTFYKGGDSTSNEKLQLNLSGVAANALVTTSADVQNIVSALNTQFGSGGAAGGLTFQLGTTSASNVTVNIANSQSTALFAGASLNVATQGAATTAGTAVQTALNTITATRSGVGSLESRFGFASAAIQVGLQNQTAAKSSLLDTNITSESTAFATQQVKIQAGISVLAQANQELQALLKLIG